MSFDDLFRKDRHRQAVAELERERGSLLVLAGPARYDWRHSIPARKSDLIGDQVIPRGRRVSLTFRTVEGAALKDR